MGCVGCLRVSPVGKKMEQKRCRGAEGGRRVVTLKRHRSEKEGGFTGEETSRQRACKGPGAGVCLARLGNSQEAWAGDSKGGRGGEGLRQALSGLQVFLLTRHSY